MYLFAIIHESLFMYLSWLIFLLNFPAALLLAGATVVVHTKLELMTNPENQHAIKQSTQAFG